MRILIVNQYFPPDATNSAYVLGELAEDLARTHEVRVVAGRPSYDAHASTFRPERVRVTRVASTAFGRRRLLGRTADYATFLLSATVAALRGPRADVVVTVTNPPVVGIVGALAGVRHRCPFVLLCHDVYPDIAVALGVLRRRWLIAAWKAVSRAVRRSAASVVVVGRDIGEKFEAEGVPPAKIHFIPTWSPRFDFTVGDREATRRSLAWDGQFVVMHAGNQGLAQNVGIFADVGELLQSRDEILLVILGDGAGRPMLEREVMRRELNNVAFLDHLPKHEAQRLMAAADVHVVSLVPGLWGCAAPSKTYGIMAVGRPFVAAVDEGSEPHRIIEELRCGDRVAAGDAPALAESILRLRDQPLDEMGARARRGFEQRYERSRATAAIQALLADVVQRGAGHRSSPLIRS